MHETKLTPWTSACLRQGLVLTQATGSVLYQHSQELDLRGDAMAMAELATQFWSQLALVNNQTPAATAHGLVECGVSAVELHVVALVEHSSFSLKL